MTRRVFSILILLAIIVGTIWIFFQFKKLNEQAPDAINYIPRNVTTILKLQDENWTTFYNQGNSLTQILDPEYDQLNRIVQEIDSLRSQQEGIQDLLNLGDKYLCFFDNNQKGKDWLYAMGLLSSHDNVFVKNIFPSKIYKENLLNGNSWFQGEKLNWAIVNQVLFVSPNEEILKPCLSEDPNYQTIVQDSSFVAALYSQGMNNIQIFSRDVGDNFNLIKEKNEGWISYETRVMDNKLDFFGFTFQNNSYQGNTTTPIRIPLNLIPKKDVKIECIQIKNIAEELAQIEARILEENRLNEYTNNLTAIENNCNCEVKTIAFNRTNGYGKFSNGKHTFSYINYPNFDESIEEYAPLINDDLLDEKNGFPIFTLKYSNLYSTLLDQPSLNHLKYFTFNNEHLVFTSKIEDIHWIINQWSNQETLNTDTEFASYTSRIQSGSNWFSYEKSSSKKDLFYPFSIVSHSLVWQKDYHTKGIYNHLTMPTTGVKKVVESNQNITISDTPGKTDINSDLSSNNSFKLKGNVINSPTLVTNHYTKEKEIFVQDDQNTIYLINNKSKELWNKKIEGEILSPIKQIDVYRNGKLQLVFNTANKIYCLDRNGKHVDGFPINLKAKATSPLAIFDYDKKRKYRLVIGCSNKEIYNYTVEGKETVGWKYNAVNSAVIALEHIQIKGKDYIFSLLENNKISILKRTGVIKFKSEAKATNYNNQGYAIDYSSKIEKTRMIYLNSQGNLVGISFDNTKDEILKSGFSPRASFVYTDIDGDKKSDIILRDNQTVKAYSSNLKEIFVKNLGKNIINTPAIYKINSQDTQIGVLTSDGEFNLLDSKGEMISGYPIESSQAIRIVDLDNDGEKEKVIVIGNSVIIN